MTPRVAVVGLGYWGPNIVRNLQDLDCAEVVAVCDTDEHRLGPIKNRYPTIEVFSSLEPVLADDSIDAVAVATPVSTHFSIGRSVLEAGKHLFVEKPLASSSLECIELMELARQQGLVLMPGHTFLYSPPVVAIQEMIASGELGELFFISMSRVNLGLHQKDVSVAWDLGPHDFSILRYWLGESPVRVSALSRGYVIPSTPDVSFIDLEFARGTIAHVELSWLAPSKLRRTTIVGSQKMVVYDDTSTEPIRIFDSGVELRAPETFGEYRLTYRTGDIVSPRVSASEPLSLELRDFCDAVMAGSEPRSSPKIGLEVVRMIEAVDRSSALGGAAVSVEQSASDGRRERGVTRACPSTIS